MTINDILEYLEHEYNMWKTAQEQLEQSTLVKDQRDALVAQGAKFQTYTIWNTIRNATQIQQEYEQ